MTEVVADQQKLMTDFAEQFFVTTYDVDSSDSDYQLTVNSFVQKFIELISEMKSTDVVVDQQNLMPNFAEQFFVALYDKNDGSDPDYQTSLNGFVQNFIRLTSEMKLTLSQQSGLTKI